MEPTANESPLTVLIVDDAADIRLLLKKMLADPRWRLEEATSGEAALSRCRKGGVDVVVLDYEMPDITGLEVARRLRGEGFGAAIILFSAYLSAEIEAEARALGLETCDKANTKQLVTRVRQLAAAAAS